MYRRTPSLLTKTFRFPRLRQSRLLAIAITLSLIVSSLLTPLARPVSATSETSIYITDETGARLLPLDPNTLAPSPDGLGSFAPAPSTDSLPQWPDSPGWSTSADGSTLVRTTIHFPFTTPEGEVTITVFDAATGAVRSEFVPRSWSQQQVQLSADGRVLVIEAGLELTHGYEDHKLEFTQPPIWYIYDTTTGAEITRIVGDITAVAGMQHLGYLHPDGTRLFRFSTLGQQSESGPWPTQLVINDLATDRVTARIDLPEVMSGFWWTGRFEQSNGIPRFFDSYATPSLIFTPDGETAVVLDPTGTLITTIDLDTRVIIHRQALSLPVRATETIVNASVNGCLSGRWLCTDSIGPQVKALLMLDSDRLLLAGYNAVRSGDDDVTVTDFGLQMVSLTSGQTLAQAPVPADIDVGLQYAQSRLWPSFDGTTLYAIGLQARSLNGASTPAPDANQDTLPWRIILYRLAATDLQVNAERDISDSSFASAMILTQALPAIDNLTPIPVSDSA